MNQSGFEKYRRDYYLTVWKVCAGALLNLEPKQIHDLCVGWLDSSGGCLSNSDPLDRVVDYLVSDVFRIKDDETCYWSSLRKIRRALSGREGGYEYLARWDPLEARFRLSELVLDGDLPAHEILKLDDFENVSERARTASYRHTIRSGSITAFDDLLRRHGREELVKGLRWRHVGLAVESNQRDLLRIFLERGYDPDELSMDGRGVTPLMLAAEMGESEMVSILLRHRASFERCSTEGGTAVSFAIHSCQFETLKLLFVNGARISRDEYEQYNLLFRLMFCGRIDILTCVIERGVMVGPLEFLLLNACEFGYPKEAAYLLGRDIPVNRLFEGVPATLLEAAALGRDVAIGKMLLEHFASPEFCRKHHAISASLSPADLDAFLESLKQGASTLSQASKESELQKRPFSIIAELAGFRLEFGHDFWRFSEDKEDFLKYYDQCRGTFWFGPGRAEIGGKEVVLSDEDYEKFCAQIIVAHLAEEFTRRRAGVRPLEVNTSCLTKKFPVIARALSLAKHYCPDVELQRSLVASVMCLPLNVVKDTENMANNPPWR